MGMVKNRKLMTDLMAQGFDEPIAARMVEDALVNHRKATMQNLSAQYDDPVKLHRKATRLGYFKPYDRIPAEVSADVARAHGDELSLLS